MNTLSWKHAVFDLPYFARVSHYNHVLPCAACKVLWDTSSFLISEEQYFAVFKIYLNPVNEIP